MTQGRVRASEEILADMETSQGESPPPEGTVEEKVQELPQKKLSEIRTCFKTIINFLGKTNILRMSYDYPL